MKQIYWEEKDGAFDTPKTTEFYLISTMAQEKNYFKILLPLRDAYLT